MYFGIASDKWFWCIPWSPMYLLWNKNKSYGLIISNHSFLRQLDQLNPPTQMEVRLKCWVHSFSFSISGTRLIARPAGWRFFFHCNPPFHNSTLILSIFPILFLSFLGGRHGMTPKGSNDSITKVTWIPPRETNLWRHALSLMFWRNMNQLFYKHNQPIVRPFGKAKIGISENKTKKERQ